MCQVSTIPCRQVQSSFNYRRLPCDGSRQRRALCLRLRNAVFPASAYGSTDRRRARSRGELAEKTTASKGTGVCGGCQLHLTRPCTRRSSRSSPLWLGVDRALSRISDHWYRQLLPRTPINLALPAADYPQYARTPSTTRRCMMLDRAELKQLTTFPR